MRRKLLPLGVAVAVLVAALSWFSGTDALPAPDAEVPGAAVPVAPSARRTQPPAPAFLPSADEEVPRPLAATATALRFDAGTVTDADADAGGALVETLTRAQVERLLRDNAALAAKHVDAYCAATKDLVAEQDQHTRDRDAAIFMAGRSDWEGGKLGTLHLAASLTYRMANPPGAWRRLGPEVYAGLDFGWMTALLQFDHWSMMAAGPLRDLAPTNFMEAPIPNFITLQNWSKLRLLKGMHEGDLASASLEVRHLAELCDSTGSLIGDMIRVAILGIERGFYEEHQLSNAPALTQPEALRQRAARFAAVDFMLPGVDPATRAKALKCLPNRCTALVEAMGITAALRDLLPAPDEHLQWLRAQPQCDSRLADLAFRSPPGNVQDLLGSSVTSQFEEHLRFVLDGGVP